MNEPTKHNEQLKKVLDFCAKKYGDGSLADTLARLEQGPQDPYIFIQGILAANARQAKLLDDLYNAAHPDIRPGDQFLGEHNTISQEYAKVYVTKIREIFRDYLIEVEEATKNAG